MVISQELMTEFFNWTIFKSCCFCRCKAAYDEAQVNATQFFVNAIDTETKGLDFVITQNSRISNVKIDNNFAINLNKTKKLEQLTLPVYYNLQI